ncbi:MAG TPA: NADH-quinone oxidoreductase subunit J [Verrucomicrobiae bacterium]|nr:NADH-quinone oxidoreductase subunit J [Verrucomicrobiae bacterium]
MTAFPASNLITTAVFVVCLLTMAFGACLAVTSTRLIHSVCGLATCCFGVAGLYYFLHSPFLALMEILIYVGAVCVTIVFAVMLAEPEEPPRTEKSGSTVAWGGLALLIVIAIFCGLVWLGCRTNWPAPGDLLNDGSVAILGRALLTTYSMAFELISLALLVAILGALAIARAGRTRPEAPESRLQAVVHPILDARPATQPAPVAAINHG